MTRDEHRTQCIEAMKLAMHALGEKDYDPDAGAWISLKDMATAALDSIHGVAFVVPIEAAEEMKTLWRVNPQSRGDTYAEFLAVCHAADLTNPPESKP